MSSSISDLDLQRLVDGELSEQRQQSLLTELEAAGDWRRVALAFIEQQVWSQACRQTERQPPRPPVSVASPATPRRVASRLTVAATAVIALALGFLAGSRISEPVTGPGVADAPDRGSAADALTELQPIMNLQLVSNDPAVEEPLNIPVYDTSATASGFWEEAPLVPDDVREELFRHGYEVREAREFYRIPLDDGNVIALPVETVQVRYAGL